MAAFLEGGVVEMRPVGDGIADGAMSHGVVLQVNGARMKVQKSEDRSVYPVVDTPRTDVADP